MAANPKQSPHVTLGQGETSYARNSTFQTTEQQRMKSSIEDAITGLLGTASTVPNSILIADLGCSYGSNALALVSTAVNAVLCNCMQHEQPLPEVCVLLNDLPGNDFNSVAKSIAEFKQSFESFPPIVINSGMVPGSFHARLFSRESLHLICSSTSLHWLSEAPEDLVKRRIPMYDCDDNLRRARSGLVLDAYSRQFRKDFTQFLTVRGKELVPGGRMVISLFGRCSDNPASMATHAWEILASSLNDMVSRGVLNKEKFESFYIPMYAPSDKELRMIIQDESSFLINNIEVHKPLSGIGEVVVTPKMIALAIRSAHEAIILEHFNCSAHIMDELVETLVGQLSSGGLNRMVSEMPLVFLCASLTRKASL
ncbi:hypothetical protein SETIT_4G137600v2 [Setaria italica]|uniref:Jasmonate O-methyltransferase n=1 Tax=Setaria italica TaxID=4555 RepID=A0A368QVU4_SETIT|nr:hypothetical protein SETIT_4G137600v2 [Setaria italica]